MLVTNQAPPRRGHDRGHGPRREPLDAQKDNSRLCGCGCGEAVRPGKRFRHGHHARLQQKWDFGLAPLCKCGCGEQVRHAPGRWLKYADGHYFRARRPRHPPFVDIDPAFWDWFAGFVDGEGCFGVTISHVGGRDYPQPFFKIAVRADERLILEEIKRRLGCGRVTVHVPGASTSNLQLKFELSAVADCQRLIEVLELHPLRAKKANDLATWSELVREKAANGQSPQIWRLRERLIEGRRYNPQLAKGGDAK